ncbi:MULTISPECIES: hypothetical protein [Pseudoxanthomonas]|nr:MULTISPECIES: hypothetical protein [Pseudoxanthomonas]MDQ1134899.1 hypothetical protein [Pseudoxanthomonas winnipegensis]MDR6138868.1 hypothetical protein [Pseudoxanthomonas sp. SORGH_AS_0997]
MSRLMHQRVNGLLNSGVYFFLDGYDHVLRGFALEYVPRGLYVWNFRFPLFDFFGPNLSYSNRLSEGSFIDKAEKTEEEIVDFVLASPELAESLSGEPMTLLDFNKFLHRSHAFLNPHAQLIYAASLTLLNQEPQALAVLEKIPSTLHPKDVPSLKNLIIGIENGTAREILDDVCRKNLITLGISHLR